MFFLELKLEQQPVGLKPAEVLSSAAGSLISFRSRAHAPMWGFRVEVMSLDLGKRYRTASHQHHRETATTEAGLLQHLSFSAQSCYDYHHLELLYEERQGTTRRTYAELPRH